MAFTSKREQKNNRWIIAITTIHEPIYIAKSSKFAFSMVINIFENYVKIIYIYPEKIYALLLTHPYKEM